MGESRDGRKCLSAFITRTFSSPAAKASLSANDIQGKTGRVGDGHSSRGIGGADQTSSLTRTANEGPQQQETGKQVAGEEVVVA